MADWQGLGSKAGPIRNQRMLDDGKPDLVVAFPGGRGTADMVRRAGEAGVVTVLATPWTDLVPRSGGQVAGGDDRSVRSNYFSKN